MPAGGADTASTNRDFAITFDALKPTGKDRSHSGTDAKSEEANASGAGVARATTPGAGEEESSAIAEDVAPSANSEASKPERNVPATASEGVVDGRKMLNAPVSGAEQMHGIARATGAAKGLTVAGHPSPESGALAVDAPSKQGATTSEFAAQLTTATPRSQAREDILAPHRNGTDGSGSASPQAGEEFVRTAEIGSKHVPAGSPAAAPASGRASSSGEAISDAIPTATGQVQQQANARDWVEGGEAKMGQDRIASAANERAQLPSGKAASGARVPQGAFEAAPGHSAEPSKGQEGKAPPIPASAQADIQPNRDGIAGDPHTKSQASPSAAQLAAGGLQSIPGAERPGRRGEGSAGHGFASDIRSDIRTAAGAVRAATPARAHEAGPPGAPGPTKTTAEQTRLFDPASLVSGTADMSEVFSFDPARSQSQPQTAQMQLRGDLAPHVARQLVEVMAQAAYRPVEIALSPHELGRVRMSILADDGAITVNILAERPDTLELMRRHIDQLGQSFREMGYASVTFAFEQGHQSGDQPGSRNEDTQRGGSDAGTARSATAHSPDPAVITLDAAPQRGVDIRL